MMFAQFLLTLTVVAAYALGVFTGIYLMKHEKKEGK